MARSVDEWKGRSDDSAIPTRVKLRIWNRENGTCYLTGHKIRPGEPFDYEHKLALYLGGENRESNIFLALKDKHKEKTKQDREKKSASDKMTVKAFGMKSAKRKMQSRGFRSTPPRSKDINDL